MMQFPWEEATNCRVADTKFRISRSVEIDVQESPIAEGLFVDNHQDVVVNNRMAKVTATHHFEIGVVQYEASTIIFKVEIVPDLNNLGQFRIM